MEEIKATMQTEQEFKKERIEEGFYPCVCKEVKKISDGEYGPRIAVVCTILEHAVELVKVVYLKLTPKSAATEVLKSFGVEFEPGKEFSFNDLVGKKAIAVVEDYVYGDNQKASTISKLKPINSKPEEEGVEVEEVK